MSRRTRHAYCKFVATPKPRIFLGHYLRKKGYATDYAMNILFKKYIFFIIVANNETNVNLPLPLDSTMS